MKKVLLATVAIISFGAVSGNAADMPIKAPRMAVSSAYNWAGLYVGANGGWGQERRCETALGAPSLFLGCHNADGGFVGGQVGYRWQSSAWVFGLEAQGDWARFRGSNPTIPVPAITAQTRVRDFGLFTGQVGYAWNNTLLYAKGGAAVIENRYALIGPVVTATANDTQWGGVVGVGLEYGFMPNWSVAVEYDHIFLSNENSNFTVAGAFLGTSSFHGDADLVSARLNYRFGAMAR
jgi:outer membrane immunogenic protein